MWKEADTNITRATYRDTESNKSQIGESWSSDPVGMIAEADIGFETPLILILAVRCRQRRCLL